MNAGSAPATPAAPRLVAVIVVDGLPADQVIQFRSLLGTGGFRRFLEQGAWFGQAQYGQLTTYTAVGHATVLTGAYPYRHGLVANDWLDRATTNRVYCVEDAQSQCLDEPTKPHGGTSPRNLQVTTVGDELRVATGRQSKVLAASGKDRGAILLGGKLGDAYFYSAATGRFITSSYYRDRYPEWWEKFHAARPQDQWFGKPWELSVPASAQATRLSDGCLARITDRWVANRLPLLVAGGLKAPGPHYYSALMWTPFGDDYLEQFVEAAVRGENLGRNPAGVPDLLAVSFSTHDYVNHLSGPESKQSQDDLVRLDRTLARLLAFLDDQVGRDRLLVVLTADHGFANTPEFCRDVLRMEADRLDTEAMRRALNEALGRTFGAGDYAIAWWNPTLYLDNQLIERRHLDRAAVERAAADFLGRYPGIHSVFTRSQLAAGEVPPTAFGRAAIRAWHRQRSGDLMLIQQPGWYLSEETTDFCATHGSPWAYDTHVPLMWFGPAWIKPGRYLAGADPVDIAPTLATILGVRLPPGSEGRVLTEMVR